MNIESKVRVLKQNVVKHIKEIDSINNVLFKKLCLFALTDQFAQDANLAEQNSEIFSKFIEKFSGEEYLSNIDPITLFYRCRSELSGTEEFEEIQANICHIGDPPVYYDEKIVSNCSEKICNFILEKYSKNNKKSGNVKNIIEKHKYSLLMYKYRSKLSHELHSPSTEWAVEQTYSKPFYSSVASIGDEFTVRQELRFPYNFLKRISVKSIYSYLDSCISNQKRPFENCKEYLFWYE